MVDEWKSPEAREKFMTLYRSLRQRDWTGRTKERDVETAAGQTRVFEFHGAGEPIVLLHGANTNAYMWAQVIDHLAGSNLFVPDVPGDPGESVLAAPYGSIDALADWFVATLDALGLDAVHVAGASYGGWLATHVASRHPARVRSLMLVEPGLDPLRLGPFMVNGILTGLAVSIPGPQRMSWARRMGAADVAADPQLRKMGVMGFRSHRRDAMPKFEPVADATLRSLTMPTAVLLGKRSPIHNAEAVAARLRAVNPRADVDVLRDGLHTLPVTHAALIADKVRTFSTS